MKSDLPKALHDIAGRSLVAHVVAACRPFAEAGGDLRVVVGAGPEGERVAAAARPAKAVVQTEQRGTGHAVALALADLGPAGTLWVLNGDTPFVPTELLERLGMEIEDAGAAAALVSAEVERPAGFGRVVRAPDGAFARVVEDKDASPAERAIREINAGPYAFDIAALRAVIGRLGSDNAQGEIYLTDAFAVLVAAGQRVGVVRADDPQSVQGINSPDELAAAADSYYARRLRDLGRAGVIAASGRDVRVDALAEVRAGARLDAPVAILGRSVVEDGARIESGAHLRDTLVRGGARVGTAWIDSGR